MTRADYPARAGVSAWREWQTDGRLTGMKRCPHLLWMSVPVLLMATACTVVRPGGPALDATTLPVQTLPADDAEFLDPPAGGLAAIANVTVLDPTVAQLVGPTYGVAFQAIGTSAYIDGLTYARMSTGLHDDDISAASRGARVPAPGYEFLLAMVTEQELPEPTLGYPAQLFADWQITVDDEQRQIRSHDVRPELTTGEVILVSVPVGHDAFLSATVDGQTGAISLRTGQLMVAM